MKYLNILVTTLVLLILSWQNGDAQQGRNGIDANRMNRDINIMENILEEMFKIQAKSGTGNFVLAEGGFLRSGQDVKGTYLPGYGVIFTIPTGHTPLIYSFEDEEGKRAFSYSFVYRNGENGDNIVDDEAVTRRIKEFLRDYGSTIGQLKPDEQVMVLYGHDREDRRLVFLDSDRERTDSELPVISVVAQKKDLDAYRSGQLNDRQFDERISVSKIEDDEDRSIDLEVMANIFNTAFKERQDEASFRVRGSVNHLKLDNFGALFFFDVSYTTEPSGVFQLRSAPKIQIRRNAQKAAPAAEAEVLVELDEELKQERKEREQMEQELEEKTGSAFAEFKSQIRDYIVDYGRTLRSVGNDQYVMASITVDSRVSSIPERIDVQVKKSVLDALDRGRISREEALNEVVITEY